MSNHPFSAEVFDRKHIAAPPALGCARDASAALVAPAGVERPEPAPIASGESINGSALAAEGGKPAGTVSGAYLRLSLGVRRPQTSLSEPPNRRSA